MTKNNSSINKEIQAYNDIQSTENREICNVLAQEIGSPLSEAENKIWHAHLVWFLEGNPIVGYSKLKDCIRLLFWSGQSFEEDSLKKRGVLSQPKFGIPRRIKLTRKI